MESDGFEFTVESGLSAGEAWRRIVDVSRHGDVVPFTTGSGPAPQDARVGSRFVARTALGPVGFDDVMVIRSIDAGRRVRFEKVGRLLGGCVDVSVEPVASGCQVIWRQTIALPWVPRALRSVSGRALRFVAPAIGAGYERVVKKLLTAS